MVARRLFPLSLASVCTFDLIGFSSYTAPHRKRRGQTFSEPAWD